MYERNFPFSANVASTAQTTEKGSLEERRACAITSFSLRLLQPAHAGAMFITERLGGMAWSFPQEEICIWSHVLSGVSFAGKLSEGLSGVWVSARFWFCGCS